MNTRLRFIAPRPFVAGRHNYKPAVFWWCVAAVALQLTCSSLVIEHMGLTGMGKIHPSTIILVLCTAYAVATGMIPMGWRPREFPALLAYIVGMPALMAYSIVFVGMEGATVFIETFWSAGLLALLLEPARDEYKRMLAYILLGLVLLNVVIGIFESLTTSELFPLAFGDTPAQVTIDAGAEEFRAHALFSHPLTASLVTAMAFFLLYTMRMSYFIAAPVFAALLIGLLAYGGRTALGVVVTVSVGLALFEMVKGLLRRSLQPRFLMMVVLAAAIMPVLTAVLASQTSIGDRIFQNLYIDGSAQVRATQWEVFQHLEIRDWLFGVSKARLLMLKDQIGLAAKDTDIENFWILIFLDLGVIGFAVFTVIFTGFLRHLARFSGSLNGWLLVGAALVIDSSSNSLGVWTNDLMLEVAFVMALAGFRDYAAVRTVRQMVRRLPLNHRFWVPHSSLALAPAPLRHRSLQQSVVPRRFEQLSREPAAGYHR